MMPQKRKTTPGTSTNVESKRQQTNYNDGAQTVLPSPACPGQVKCPDSGPLSPFPPGSDIFEVFAKLREDETLSNEEAFLKFLEIYNVSTSTLAKAIGEKHLNVSFSNVNFPQVAPFVWLDPDAGGHDILPLEIFRCRIPRNMFYDICQEVNHALCLYGPIISHDNEESRSRFISSLFTTIVCLFGGTISNRPEGILEGEFTRNGRIEHHFISLDTVSIVFVEVKRLLAFGKQRLDTKAQVLAECAACDRANRKRGFWVPILAILCDGLDFEYFVFDSADKQVYCSGSVGGLVAKEQDGRELLVSIKKSTEHLFDWFLMSYINGIRAFWARSSIKSTQKKRASTVKWSGALAAAEAAHSLLRQAANAAGEKNYDNAESMAAAGIEKIKASVAELPYRKPNNVDLLEVWDGTRCIEESLAGMNFF